MHIMGETIKYTYISSYARGERGSGGIRGEEIESETEVSRRKVWWKWSNSFSYHSILLAVPSQYSR